MLRCGLFVAVLVAPAAVARPGGPVVFHMGDLPGGPTASRAFGAGWVDGGIALVGESSDAAGTWAVVWTRQQGLRRLGTLSPADQFSQATGCTQGTAPLPVVIGHSGFAPSPGECRAFRWSPATGMEPIPGPPGGTADMALGISAQGTVIVGQASVAGAPRAFRSVSGVTAVLGALPGAHSANSGATAVSGNGQVVVGHAMDTAFVVHAVRWPTPLQAVSLGHLNAAGFRDSRAHACSYDGSVIVGQSTSPAGPQEAFRWTAQTGMVGLGDLPGGEFRSVALGCHEGWVTGWSDTAEGPRAFLWSASTGMRPMQEYVQGWPGTAGWTLTRAFSGAPEGGAGTGRNALGAEEGWIADVSGCYADCNSDRVLNLADFGCFQTQFVLDPYADCNRDGRLNLADFGCFQTHFALGCP